ncbi:hypothetical protein PORY_001353 [Pneumocystis oryctolagi]|uniref:Uncharacterized protein n=1 Tax=Pneumocystis oryctolagi TaxID=42067 RepID=A0ACB7CE00_9ASCO|nr:hypothetical protein PORY_001353 [Pneumocystis oryctolagi]
MLSDVLSLTLATSDKYDEDSCGITKSMRDEEMEMIRSSIDEAQKQKESVRNSVVVDDKSIARLKFLLEKSKIYVLILSEKLQKRQILCNEMERTLKSSKEKKDKNTLSCSDLSDFSKNDEKENILKSTKNKVLLNRKAVTKHKLNNGNYHITDYFHKKETNDIVSAESVVEPLHEIKVENNRSVDESFSVASETPPLVSQPKLITGCVLRDYQLAGVEWLISLYENGLNGILADEMGLGKTLQTISFLAFLREKGIYGPFLIATPLSTISNWISEFKKFAPGIPVLLYHGSKQERLDLRKNKMEITHPDFPVIVTSYEIIMNDKVYLRRYQWKYIVVDEGHRIKNLNCKLIRELKGYDSANRLLLTGTPLQNNLAELWSLLNFLLPDIFDDLDSFQSWFDFSMFQNKDKNVLLDDVDIVSTLHCILKPFLLRRLKSDVEQSVSKKREYILYAPMTAYQTELYNAILNKDARDCLLRKYFNGFTDDQNLEIDKQKPCIENYYPSKFSKVSLSVSHRTRSRTMACKLSDDESFDNLDGYSLDESVLKHKPLRKEKYEKHIPRLKLQNLVMQLRKVCNHPYMIDFPTLLNSNEFLIDENIVNVSGKMLLLKRLLFALFKDDHKVLIFSQFSKMLDIIELWSVDIQKWKICRIDGLTKRNERKEQIEEFCKNPNIKLFLLSTRAGGLGINLTAADTVIIFDSDWNPQQDLQAQDRVHRIGQTKPVIVYRLISANTVENRILEKANAKRRLEKLVIQKGKFKSLIPTSSSKDDIEELSSTLLFDDAKKIIIKEKDDEILSNEDLESLLDRSDEAYQNSEKKNVSCTNYRFVG